VRGSWTELGWAYRASALYVVDLKRFREIAAGDQIRGQYQSLSSDPNSLANLDQVRDYSSPERVSGPGSANVLRCITCNALVAGSA